MKYQILFSGKNKKSISECLNKLDRGRFSSMIHLVFILLGHLSLVFDFIYYYLLSAYQNISK